MTSSRKNLIKFVVAGVLILGNLADGDIGLSIPSTPEQAGFVLATLLMYILAGWLLYSAYKSKSV